MSDTAIHVNWEDLIRFYAEAGVDSALCDEPVDRFAEALSPPPSIRLPQSDNRGSVSNAAQVEPRNDAGQAQNRPTKSQAASNNAPAAGAIAAKAAIAPELLLAEARNKWFA